MDNHPYAKSGQESYEKSRWSARRRTCSADWKSWKQQRREPKSQLCMETGAKGSFETLNAALGAAQREGADPEASGSGYGRPSTTRTEDELDELESPDALCAKAVALREAAQLVPYQGMAWHVLLKESNRLTAIHNSKRHCSSNVAAQKELLQIEYQSQMADLTRCWTDRLRALEQQQEIKGRLEKIESELTSRTLARDKVAAQLYAVTKIHEEIPRIPNPVYMPAAKPRATDSEAYWSSWSRARQTPCPAPKQPTLAPPVIATENVSGSVTAQPKPSPAHPAALQVPEAEEAMGWRQQIQAQLQELMLKVAAGPGPVASADAATPKAWLYPRREGHARDEDSQGMAPAPVPTQVLEQASMWLRAVETTAPMEGVVEAPPTGADASQPINVDEST